MKILFVSMTFPDDLSPERGTYNLELCLALAEKHQVQVIAPRSWHEWLGGKGLAGSFRCSAETVSHCLPAHFPLYYYFPRFWPQMIGTAFWWSIRSTVRRIAKTFRPDVVISYWAFPDGAGALSAAMYFGVPSLVIVGGSDVLL